MATAERPTTRTSEADAQVYHPLDRLRGIIRRYIVIEGAISVCLFVAMWFALGLILDYGLFKVTGWDWVLDGAWSVRFLALMVALGLFGAFLIFRIITRVTKEFSYPALALVLERKFPKVLGDRLITAVEMADVESMGKFGYSKQMIRATIDEARERVGTVDVRQVFNWKRLWLMGFAAAGLLLATGVVAFASHAIATKSVSPARFGWKFAHVSGIFLERNVALMDTPWPRRAHLELVDFPADGELAVGIGQDSRPPQITARAYRWVIADRTNPTGWRPLLWTDLTDAFVGRSVPTFEFGQLALNGETPSKLPADPKAWTVDSVEQRLATTDPGSQILLQMRLGDTLGELQAVFVALTEKADKPSMGRTLRKLDMPGEVTFKYSGRRTTGNGTLTARENNEFTGEITGLKEDVEFVVKAADFSTQPNRIRLIPPPALKRLYRIQHEPAYLHHATPAETADEFLKGKRQLIAEKNISLTGERSVMVVPAGTQVVLHGEAYRDDKGTLLDTDQLASVTATPVSGAYPGAKFDETGKMTQSPVPVELSTEGDRFRIAFKNFADDFDVTTAAAFAAVKGAYPEKDARANFDYRLKEPVEFKLTFTNKFGVYATRSIVIQVAQDQPPVVELSVDVIRKVGNYYMVTPQAKIPFNPESFVRDDHGLSRVEYTFNYFAEDSDVVRALRAGYVTRLFLDIPRPGNIGNNALPLMHVDNYRKIDKSDDKLEGSVFVSEFKNQEALLRRNTVGMFMELLGKPLGEDSVGEAVRRVDLKNENRDYFDLKELNDKGILKILAKPGEVQQIYRMDLNLKATDNNFDNDGGPRVTFGSEPIRLRIVSEGDLLLEINREEELLGIRLDEALLKLAAAKRKYEYVSSTNGFKDESPEQVDAVKVRSQDALQDVDKARDIVQGVLREYRRISRECLVNRMNEATSTHYSTFSDKLDSILSEDPTKPIAFPKTQALLNNVQGSLNTGRWAPGAAVSDAQISLFNLERELAKIRSEIGEAQTKDKLIRTLRKLKEDQERVADQLKKLAIKRDEIFSGSTPLIGNLGAQAFAKGETKKLQHTINWRQFKRDDLKVKVTASDPSIVVPAELNLNFEKDQFRFSYEVKAGQKEGDYKITLTPEEGEKIEIVITVK
jgi:hypothetical protein